MKASIGVRTHLAFRSFGCEGRTGALNAQWSLFGAAPAAGPLTGARARRPFRQPEPHRARCGPAEEPAPVDLALHGRYDARPRRTRTTNFPNPDLPFDCTGLAFATGFVEVDQPCRRLS